MTAYGQSERWQTRPNWKANIAATNANRLARQYGSEERISTSDVLALWERQPTCADCGQGRGLDHVEPVRLGGRNHPSNLRNLCRMCNARRGGINSGIERRKRREAAAGLPPTDPQSYLTLSVAGELLREADQSPAARIGDLLELEQRARDLGRHDLAAFYADRIVDEMLGGAA